MPESFGAKVAAIKESKDLDEIKIQELVGSLQTYELGLPSHKSSKSLALKTIKGEPVNPRMRMMLRKRWLTLQRISVNF